MDLPEPAGPVTSWMSQRPMLFGAVWEVVGRMGDVAFFCVGLEGH